MAQSYRPAQCAKRLHTRDSAVGPCIARSKQSVYLTRDTCNDTCDAILGMLYIRARLLILDDWNVPECRKLFSVEIRYRTFLTLVRDGRYYYTCGIKFTMRFISARVAGEHELLRYRGNFSLSLSFSFFFSYADTRSIHSIRRIKRLEIGRNGECTEI